MKKIIIVVKLIALMLFSVSVNEVNAQQSRIDSIVQMLGQSKIEKGIDTTLFTAATSLIEKSALNDTSIAVLEKAGNGFTNGTDEYWSYRVKYSILNSLIATDKSKSLTYGKYQLEELKKSKTPEVSFISSAFFKQLRLPYRNSNMLKEGFEYYNEKLKGYKQKNDSAGLADCYYVLAGFYRNIGLLDQSIYNMKKSVSYMAADENMDSRATPFRNPVGRNQRFNNISIIGIYYMQKGDYYEAIAYTRIKFNEDNRVNTTSIQTTPVAIAQAKILSGQLDSVMYYIDLTLNHKQSQKEPEFIAFALQIQALYKIKIGSLDEADTILKQCWQLIEENKLQADARPGTIAPDYYLALLRIKQNRIDEAIALLTKDIRRLKTQRLFVLRDYKLLAELYEQTGRYEKANEAYKSFISLQDSLKVDQSKFGSLSFETEQQMNEKELSITKLESKNKIADLSRNFTIGIAALLLILAGSIYYRFHSKKKANLVLEKTLIDLKSTQSQLIQSEKMASLGELTAGIAHEIQNPLNFVNNFSEVSRELIDELKNQKSKLKSEEQDELLNDIDSNLEKINHHGKRAADIVKGMLQHSRSSNGIKEPTDINALCDEYLRLSYHGLKAKDKNFNATMKTDFDESIGNINIVPQDIGRVVLNLINNAFYAAPRTPFLPFALLGNPQGGGSDPDYKHVPTVWVSTKKVGDKVFISVRDNGPGIPQKILDKIFQPFFTTKPTGQGTGLGLSLSYDIVKAHGGEIKVETIEGEGSEFIVELPLNK